MNNSISTTQPEQRDMAHESPRLCIDKNVDKSKKLQKSIRAKQQQCYANAWKAIEMQDEYKNATYVEGMAVDGLAFEHGWIEHEGEIIDPTLPDVPLVYFPGLRFQGRDGLDSTWRIPGVLKTGEKLPIFYRFGWGGVKSPEFLEAIINAYRFAGMDAVADTYAKRKSATISVPLKAG